VVDGESVQVNSASSIPFAPFEEKEKIADVKVRRRKINFINLIRLIYSDQFFNPVSQKV
jgi:hypothetical protein